ncbi:MAG TPA: MMPL family transporter [Acidimicrobiales bacterium]|nr:MMPL family transporter [Acidimicrobiales bacterium]
MKSELDRATPATSQVNDSALGRLGRWCYDRRRLVLVLWVAGLIALTIVAQAAPGQFTDRFGSGHSESDRVQTILQQAFPARAGDTGDVVFQTSQPVTSPASQAAIARVISQLQPLPHVSGVRSPFSPGAGNQISANGHIAYAEVQFDTQTPDLPKSAAQKVVDTARASAAPGFNVQLGGPPIEKAVTAQPGASEGVGILAAIIIMLIAFGSVIAMGLPILIALFGIGAGVAIIDVISHAVTVPSFGTQLAGMIGLGVGIDYALLVVTRHRRALADGMSPRDSVALSLATSGRAVLFAGSTVVISLLGLLVMNLPFMYGLSFGAIAAVALVMIGTLTLLPAMLGFAGLAIDRLRVPTRRRRGPQRPPVSFRWSRVVQRRPWPAALAALATLVVLAVPLFSMNLAFTDAGNGPPSLTTTQAYDLLAEGFGPGANGPLVLAAQMPGAAGRPTVDRLATQLRATPGVAQVAPPAFNAADNTAVITVIPTTSPQDKATQSLVHRIRDSVVPSVTSGSGVRVLVGGVTAAAVDAANYMSGRLPWVIGGVVVVSFLLLMAVFRSLVIPLKAAVMNLLSVGAAFGVIVAVFQWGWLGSLVGISRTGPIDPWIPLMLFTILFGLSMDYEVFLLSRIREEWRRTGDNATAVADGLAKTARVITAAAAIMVCVFGSFVIGDVRVLKVFGLGLAVAVFIDATIVRMVLVPAVMELLGKANWWFPRSLDRIVPRLGVEVDVDDYEPSRPLAPTSPRDGDPVLTG